MYISLDLETTGFDPINDKIIEFGAVKFNKEGETIATLQFLCNPNLTLPQIITHITHITDEDLKGTPQFEEKIPEIKEFIEDLPIIGHNIQFDIGFLRANNVEITNVEYDTQEMASILLPELQSHSLEVISGKLKLQHEEKHRALDDSIAAMELFLKLIKKFEELDAKTMEEIKSLSQKSDWPLKNLLAEIKFTGPAQNEEISTASTPQLNSNYQTILDTKESALFETSSPYPELTEDLLAKADSNTYIAVASELPQSAAKIDAEENYISITRFNQLKEKNHFENHEISTIIKTLVWLKKTDTGLLRELKLFGQEKSVITNLNINPGTEEKDSYYKKALEKSQNSPTICTHEFLIKGDIENKDLIIIDFESFMQTLRHKNSEFIKLDYLINPLQSLEKLFPEHETIKNLIDKCTILFGIVGMLFKKYHDPTSYTLRCVIDEGTTNAREWLQIRDMVNNLIELSHELGTIKSETSFSYLHQWKEKLNTLSNLFREPGTESNFIWIEPDHIQNLMVQKSPYQLANPLNSILSSSKTYKLIGENLDLKDEGAFIKKLYELPEELTIHKNPQQNFNITIMKNLDNNDKNALPNFLLDYFEKNKKKKAALIFNAKKQLQFITLQLSQKNISIISQITGSPGKIRALLAQEKEECLLLITPRTWEQMEDYSQISTLFISKLPFDPPSDPELIIQSRKFKNPFDEFQVKRAIIKLKNLISRLGDQAGKEVFILDERIIERNYSKDFLRNIQTLGYNA